MVPVRRERMGDEVVQLYIHDMVSSTTRPVRELKGFRRITLVPNESRLVEFKLYRDSLKYYDRNGKAVVEHGTFKVWVGGSSVSGLEGEFRYAGRETISPPSKNHAVVRARTTLGASKFSELSGVGAA